MLVLAGGLYPKHVQLSVRPQQSLSLCMSDLQMQSFHVWCRLAVGQTKQADSVDAQWRAAAHGYAAQVLHPERYPLTFHTPLHKVCMRFLSYVH